MAVHFAQALIIPSSALVQPVGAQQPMLPPPKDPAPAAQPYNYDTTPTIDRAALRTNSRPPSGWTPADFANRAALDETWTAVFSDSRVSGIRPGVWYRQEQTHEGKKTGHELGLFKIDENSYIVTVGQQAMVFTRADSRSPWQVSYGTLGADGKFQPQETPPQGATQLERAGMLLRPWDRIEPRTPTRFNYEGPPILPKDLRATVIGENGVGINGEPNAAEDAWTTTFGTARLNEKLPTGDWYVQEQNPGHSFKIFKVDDNCYVLVTDAHADATNRHPINEYRQDVMVFTRPQPTEQNPTPRWRVSVGDMDSAGRFHPSSEPDDLVRTLTRDTSGTSQLRRRADTLRVDTPILPYIPPKR